MRQIERKKTFFDHLRDVWAKCGYIFGGRRRIGRTTMTFELPLFPLNVVLFPGMPLPLHIFEPRYRRMMGRCLETDRTFGVALLVDGEEGQAGTLPADVGCMAEIMEVAPFADGRMNLQTIGTRRFRILEVRDEDECLVGICEWLEDEATSDNTVDAADRARHQLGRYFNALSQSVTLPAQLDELDVPEEPEALSLFIAAIMLLPNDQKQKLLELTSTDVRLEVEEFLLERAEIVQRAYAQRVARGESEPPADASSGLLSGFISLN